MIFFQLIDAGKTAKTHLTFLRYHLLSYVLIQYILKCIFFRLCLSTLDRHGHPNKRGAVVQGP